MKSKKNSERGKFKSIEDMSREELVSVIKTLDRTLFRCAVAINTECFRTDNVEKLIKEAYQSWFYLDAIGAGRVNTSADGFCCLNNPMAVQRKFLSFAKSKHSNRNNEKG